MNEPISSDKLLTPAQVARLFGVDPKTVTRWGQQGRLSYVTTPGGHRRYLHSEVMEYLTPQRDVPDEEEESV